MTFKLVLVLLLIFLILSIKCVSKQIKVKHFYIKICTKEGMMLDFPKILRIDNLNSCLNKYPPKFNAGGGHFFGKPCIVSTVKLVKLIMLLFFFYFPSVFIQ